MTQKTDTLWVFQKTKLRVSPGLFKRQPVLRQTPFKKVSAWNQFLVALWQVDLQDSWFQVLWRLFDALQLQQGGAAAAVPPSAPQHQSGYLPQQLQSAGGGAPPPLQELEPFNHRLNYDRKLQAY